MQDYVEVDDDEIKDYNILCMHIELFVFCNQCYVNEYIRDLLLIFSSPSLHMSM